MSFGFSVSDIILLSQLAYKLYAAVTSGRRNASHDLKELEDVLFGLRCALDHLRHVANDISATATAATIDQQDSAAIEMRRKLNQMVQSCATTLEELDAVTKKYREGVKPGAIEDVEDDASTTQRRGRKPPIAVGKLKRSVASNFIKVRWDMDKQALKVYRDKLQSHTDAINIVLNTFLWSTTHQIQTDGRVNAEKMQELQNQALQSNSSLLQLVQDIHSMLLAAKNAPPAPPFQPPGPKQGISAQFSLSKGVTKTMGLHAMEINSIDAHYGSHIAMNMMHHTFPGATDDSDPILDINTPPARPFIACRMEPNPKTPPKNLPPAIVSLNARRQSTGAKEFTKCKEKHTPIPRPSFLTLDVPTLPQLRDGLLYIFRNFPPSTPRQTYIAQETRKSEINRWTHALDHLLNSCMLGSTSPPNKDLKLLDAQQSDVVDLLVHLNGAIHKSDVKMRGLFYQASGAARIDHVLDKLLAVSKSVRGMKEVEEFADVWEDWKQEHGDR